MLSFLIEIGSDALKGSIVPHDESRDFFVSWSAQTRCTAKGVGTSGDRSRISIPVPSAPPSDSSDVTAAAEEGNVESDGVEVEKSFVTLPEIIGIGFEGKSDLFSIMKQMVD